MTKKCGYVALLGTPNAGKSTLLNSLLGRKLTIVSNKPQTTRNKILGVYTVDDYQALFFDTPGIHNSKGFPHINQMMNKIAWSVLHDADLVCYLIDVTKGWTQEDEKWLKYISKEYHKKVILLVTKSDKVKAVEVKKGVADIAQEFQKFYPTEEPLAVSAKKPADVAFLRKMILEQLPAGEWLYAESDLTDQPQSFICAELIREQVFRQLGQELPYKIAVTVDSMEPYNKLTVTKFDTLELRATIIVDRPSQKGMVIGKQGIRIKSIGTEARIALENYLNKKVYLDLFVKVKSGWTEDPNLLVEFANIHVSSSDKFFGDQT